MSDDAVDTITRPDGRLEELEAATDFEEQPVLLQRPTLRTVLLSTVTTLAGAGLTLVLFSNAYAGAAHGPSTDEPDPAAAPVAAVQQYTAPTSGALKRVKRDSLTAFAVSVPDPDASSVADLPPMKPVAPAGEAQQYASAQVAAHGWSKKDFACLVSLWSRESGWNAHAGRVDGPYGIPQAYPGTKMASAGGDWRNDHRVQITWGLGYIAGRYGSPCGAWAHSEATGSY